MVVGSTGSRIHPLRTVHVVMQETLADRNREGIDGDPAKACRPFESNRAGMVLGEGAGALLLEEMESAKKRGARILGEVTGYGSSLVTKDGKPDCRTAIANVIEGTLETSGYQAKDIGHVHAHGLGSISIDAQEATAIQAILDQVPVTAAKSYMGNLGAGSGLVELISSVLAMQNDQLFPILNYDSPADDCPINGVGQACSPGKSFLNLSCTPQGQASAVSVARV